MRAVILLGAGDFGFLATTSHVKVPASEALPAASIWRTWSVCVPLARFVNAIGEPHGTNVAPSSEHSSLAPFSTLTSKRAVVFVVLVSGPVISGGATGLAGWTPPRVCGA